MRGAIYYLCLLLIIICYLFWLVFISLSSATDHNVLSLSATHSNVLSLSANYLDRRSLSTTHHNVLSLIATHLNVISVTYHNVL